MKLGPKLIIFLPQHGKSLSTPIYDMLLWLRVPLFMLLCLITCNDYRVMTSNCHDLYLHTLLITMSFSCHRMDGG
jgi:hypothetical protein